MPIKRRNTKIIYCDAVAVLFSIILIAFFFYRAAYGINAVDESFYLAVAQRFVKGDRPLVDEYHISTISNLFHIPFYLFFTRLTGGVGGIVLFMRRVFVVFDFFFFWIIYLRLRMHRIWGFFAAAVIAAYVPWGEFTLSYYTMTPGFVTLICLILFFGKNEPSTGKLLLSGVLLSVSVLIEPPFLTVYLLYSLFVLILDIRKKRKGIESPYGLFANRRCWLYITAAATVCAALFIVFLSLKSGLKNIFAALPDILSDSAHDFSLGGNVKYFLLGKLRTEADVFGDVNFFLSIALCAAVLIYKHSSGTAWGKYLLFLLSNLLLLSMCAYPILRGLTDEFGGWHDDFYYTVTPFPLYTFGFVNCQLCESKDRRLFPIWIISLISSLALDSFSDVTCCFCGTLAAIPGFICFGKLLKESVELVKSADVATPKGKKDKNKIIYKKNGIKCLRVFTGVSTAILAVFLVWECANIYFEGTFFQTADESPTAELEIIDEGAYKDIVTTPDFVQIYSSILSDVTLIKSMNPGSVYHDQPQPIAILDADLAITNCSVWPLPSSRDRQLRYFISHPEKKPDVIYYYCYDNSGFDEEEVSLFKEYSELLCDGTVYEGKAGIIVKVEKWKDPSDPAIMEWVLEHQKKF